ncbi:hypothetical protein VKT23_012754 [Stygiomarasmius scandens]|uniref:Uncharacterized protein n=1 Tax=Marasmiellus scandens TaxID=2682957 RepID=A0ABR1J5L7_9AGAR
MATTALADQIVSVSAGTLDEPYLSRWRPDKEQYVSCRSGWLPEDLGAFQEGLTISDETGGGLESGGGVKEDERYVRGVNGGKGEKTGRIIKSQI